MTGQPFDIDLLKAAAAGDPSNPVVMNARQELIRMGVEPPRSPGTPPFWLPSGARKAYAAMERGFANQVTGNPRAPKSTPVSSGVPVEAMRQPPREFYEGMGGEPSGAPTDAPLPDLYAADPSVFEGMGATPSGRFVDPTGQPPPIDFPPDAPPESVADEVAPGMRGVLDSVLNRPRTAGPGGSLGASIPPPPSLPPLRAAPSTPQQAGAAAADAAAPSEMDTMLDGYMRDLLDNKGADKDRALAIALIGANIAAGNSPNALQNIGAGVAKGLPMLADQSRQAEERKGRALQLGLQREDRRERKVDRAEDRDLRRTDQEMRRQEMGLRAQYQQGSLSLQQYQADLARLREEREANRGDYGPAVGTDEKGNAVVVDRLTGAPRVLDGVKPTARGGAGAGSSSVERIAAMLREEDPSLSPRDAFEIASGIAARREMQDQRLGSVSERLDRSIAAQAERLSATDAGRFRRDVANHRADLSKAWRDAGRRLTPEKEAEFDAQAEAFGQRWLSGAGGAPAASPAPAAAPRAAAPAPTNAPAVGQTATNPQTGAKVRWTGSAWEPVGR
jgi:hypothetical protein